MKHASWTLSVGFLLTLSSYGFAYESITVTNGGAISGKVKLDGQEPPPLAYNLTLNNDTEFCGRISTGTGWRIVDEFQVGPDSGLANTVVFLEGVYQGKPFPETPPATITTQDCMFTPALTVVRDQQLINIINMDPIVHDVQVYETASFGPKIMFHRPLRLNPFHPKHLLKDHVHEPGEPMVDTLQFTHGRRLLFLECGFHAYMQTWGVAVNNPYYAVTDNEGNFSITDIPEGVYQLIAWHAGMAGYLDMKVVVLAGENLKTQFVFQNPRDKRWSHTTMRRNFRYSPEALGREGAVIDIRVTHQQQADGDGYKPIPNLEYHLEHHPEH
ncbi:MAG: carboxypeptidase-like regulatory domain-containing protein [Nitrospirales bacterium]|nr:carboxypeptidase-like regulatory domain-containing protein [Nitrospirales bacterium]